MKKLAIGLMTAFALNCGAATQIYPKVYSLVNTNPYIGYGVGAFSGASGYYTSVVDNVLWQSTNGYGIYSNSPTTYMLTNGTESATNTVDLNNRPFYAGPFPSFKLVSAGVIQSNVMELSAYITSVAGTNASGGTNNTWTNTTLADGSIIYEGGDVYIGGTGIYRVSKIGDVYGNAFSLSSGALSVASIASGGDIITSSGAFTGRGDGITSLTPASLQATNTVPPLASAFVLVDATGTNFYFTQAIPQAMLSGTLTNALTNSVANQVGSLTLGTTSPTQFKLTDDPVRVPTAAVAVISPSKTNSAAILDIMPTSSDGYRVTNNLGLGEAWIDILDRNLFTSSNSNNWCVARMAMVNSATPNARAEVKLGAYAGGTNFVPNLTLNANQITFAVQSTATNSATSAGSIDNTGTLNWGLSNFFQIYNALGVWIKNYGLSFKENIPLRWYNSAVGLQSYVAQISASTDGLVSLRTNLNVYGTITAPSHAFTNSTAAPDLAKFTNVFGTTWIKTNWIISNVDGVLYKFGCTNGGGITQIAL